MSLPNLLFITPSLPSMPGTGTMLRSAMSFEVLSTRFQVHVLNLNLWSTGFGKLSLVHNRAASYTEVSGGSRDIEDGTLLDNFYPGVRFAAIHTYRLALARVALGILARIKTHQPYLVLDLDDDECAISTHLLSLLEEDRDLEAAKHLRAEQPQLLMLQRLMAHRFDAISMASLHDCRVLAQRYPEASVHHLPNGVRIPENPDAEAFRDRRARTARILFVGALNYPPNTDGIGFFCDQVLPLIQERAGIPVSLQVVGSDPPARVARLTRNLAVTIHGNVPSVEPYYRDADLCIVPLRAGSGTRIKILEAFSFQRPVVSTRLGAEGLDVTDGEHLLLADEPEAMAQACLKMLDDGESRDRMVCSAYAWVREKHSVASIQAAMDSIYQPVLAPLATADLPREEHTRRDEYRP
jgi:glycosyltransferase involved in cell wall biosynthesis